jgi:hypothetical protein
MVQMIPDLPAQSETQLLAVPDERTNTADDLDGVNVSGYIGDMAIDAMFEAIGTGSTKTVTITIQHNDVADGGDGGWTDVDADALIEPATGEEAVFDVVGTEAYHDRLALKKERVKQYVRAVLTCGSADVVHNGAVLLTGQLKYA